MPPGKIIVYGVSWCGDCQRTQSYLNNNNISYDWINIDSNPSGEQFVLKVNKGMRSVPTIIFEDDSILVEPTIRQLSQKLDQMNNNTS